jgi:CDP-diacylglycerol--glycerol-3-phosphate 3-phosphatidyltransferase
MASPLRRKIPNALTVLRLVLAAGFFAALGAFRYPEQGVAWANLAVGLFILAAITDALDGALARRWHATSLFGRIMDPFCDKVLVLGAFVCLAGPRFVIREGVSDADAPTMASGVYPWMVVVVLARELLVTSFRGAAEALGLSFASRWSGKWKMILQSVAIPTVIFLVANFRAAPWAAWCVTAMVYTTLLVTVWSGLPYVAAFRQAMAGPPGAGGATRSAEAAGSREP